MENITPIINKLVNIKINNKKSHSFIVKFNSFLKPKISTKYYIKKHLKKL